MTKIKNLPSTIEDANGLNNAFFRTAFEHSGAGKAVGNASGHWLKVNRRFCDMLGYDSAELVSRHFTEFSHPEEIDEALALLRELHLLKLPSYSRERRYRHKNGSYIWVYQVVSFVPDEQGRPYHTEVVEDVTRRQMAFFALRANERQLRNATLGALPGQPEGILANIPGMVFQLQEQGEALSFTYASNGANDVCGIAPGQLTMGPNVFLGLLHRADHESFHRSRHRSAAELTAWNWEGRLKLEEHSIKWINVRATPRRLGKTGTIWDGVILNISESKEAEAKTKRSLQVLRGLSAYLMEAREDEGKRIAREIHDELGQRLTVLRMDVMMLPKTRAPLTEAADRMKYTIDGILRIVRDISAHLRPATLDIGLVLAMESLLDDFRTSLQIPIHFHNKLDEDIELNEELATGVFRILQESLTNIARYANASRIEVMLEAVDGHLHLHVKDDGAGFELRSSDSEKTFGLRGMRERAIALGGEVSILSAPQAGTSVFVSIPLLEKP